MSFQGGQKCLYCGGLICGDDSRRQAEFGGAKICECEDTAKIFPFSQGQRQFGWECPRCHKINSPLEASCNCKEAA